MTKDNYPMTPAVRFLREKAQSFVPHIFEYEEKGGTRHTALELGVDEHVVIKTIVMVTDAGRGLIVLMHGDYEVSTKELARVLGVKKVEPAEERKALNWTGYQFGGTSPFGIKMNLPVYAESSIFQERKIFINGGKRGFILEIEPSQLKSTISITEVEVKIKK